MEDNRFPFDSGFDDGVYGTGCTEPPKSHRAIVALLLVAVIFLGGISTALSVLNIKMFQKLNEQEATAVAYASADSRAVQASVPTAPLREEQTTVAIHEAPEKPESQEEGLSLQEIYEQNIPSVVSITASTLGTTATGTGVVLSGKGYLVTNYHVIEDAQRLTVRLTDERELEAAVVGTDPVSDLAVLYIRAENLTAAQFGDSDALRVGDTVVAIGDPLGVELRGTMTNGIVSAINRDVSVNGRTMNLIQTNAALNSGQLRRSPDQQLRPGGGDQHHEDRCLYRQIRSRGPGLCHPQRHGDGDRQPAHQPGLCVRPSLAGDQGQRISPPSTSGSTGSRQGCISLRSSPAVRQRRRALWPGIF